MIGIYRFSVDLGRSGELEGIFVEDPKNIDKIIGTTIHFGEILGKHSDVSFEIEDDMFTLVTDDGDAVDMFQRYNLETGIDPFRYIDIDEWEKEDEDDPDNDKIEADDL